jgi:hypothetical protein
MKPVTLTLVATVQATTYEFRGDRMGWALCTVNDATGELSIQSDWGRWAHRWNARPENLGAPTLTAFIATRSCIDYLARKLQNEGTSGRRWSGEATARALQHKLCERRLEDGRERLEARLEPDEMHLAGSSGRWDEDGLPIVSHRMPEAYRNGRSWDASGRPYDPLPYLSKATARRIFDMIGELGVETDRHDLFYERFWHIDGVADYVTTEPWEYGVTEQTPEDKALRDIVLPALIIACRGPDEQRQAG